MQNNFLTTKEINQTWLSISLDLAIFHECPWLGSKHLQCSISHNRENMVTVQCIWSCIDICTITYRVICPQSMYCKMIDLAFCVT